VVGGAATAVAVTGSRDQANTSTTTSPSSKMSAADQKLLAKAKQNGTSFNTAADAKADFQKKYAKQYSSSFSSEPKTRPSYIPSSYSSNGRNYTVVYDRGHGGYGYYDALGTWMLYDAMSDAIMMNSLMSNRGYYYGQPVANQDEIVTTTSKTVTDSLTGEQITTTQKITTHQTPASSHRGSSAGMVFIVLLGIVVVIVVIVAIAKASR
jgi:hypothetical protein